MAWTGEQQAWDRLEQLDPAEVQASARVRFDQAAAAYSVPCLGQHVLVSLADRRIIAANDLGRHLTEGLGDVSGVSILGYLLHARGGPLSGAFVPPGELPGGAMFSKGAHVLPLDKIAERYAVSPEAFQDKGRKLGGSAWDHGDMAVKLAVFPKVPVAFVVWLGDEDFPSACSQLFDPAGVQHMPTDVVWSMAAMSVDMMLA